MTTSSPMPARPKAVFVTESNSGIIESVYPPTQRERLARLVNLHPTVVTRAQWSTEPALREARYLFSTWGFPKLTPADLDLLPKLQAVFYAAGTVQEFAKPLLDRGIKVISAWEANAIPVSEFALAQILLSLKRAFAHDRALHQLGREGWKRQSMPGAYGSTVALISLGAIGRRVVDLLKPFDIKLIAYEPFPAPGMEHVERVSLQECFARADVVSLHAPNRPETRHMITGELLASMKPYATFINTARGAIVDSAAMLDVLARRPDLTAVIDVTDPQEPPPAGSPFYTLPNLFLTPHIAGSQGNEVHRMASWVIDDCERLLNGQPLRFNVTESMLSRMA